MSTASDETTVKMITVDGNRYFEVKLEDPDGNGFLTERVKLDKESNHQEVEDEIEEAKDRLRSRKNRDENPEEDWHTEFADLADET